MSIATPFDETLYTAGVAVLLPQNNGTADNCGKSAAILVRESGPHYMFWGIPTIAVSISHDLLVRLSSAAPLG
jgi:hypothetical protein